MADPDTQEPKRGSLARRVGAPTLIGLLFATVGVLSTIAWDYYRSRIQLELQHLTTSILVQPGANIEGLHISFASRVIPSLSQLEFVLLNTGSRPIRGEDLVSRPTLRFVDDVELLDVATQSVVPDNLQHTLTMDSVDRSVTLDFPLMNPGDRVRFTVLATGLSPGFTAAARVVGLNRLEVSDRREGAEGDARDLSWTVYALAGISALLLFGSLLGIYGNGREKELARLAKRGLLVLPLGKTGAEYRQYITELYSDPKSAELPRVMSYLDKVDGEVPLADTESQDLNALLGNALRDTRGSTVSLAIGGALALLGTAYVLSAFL